MRIDHGVNENPYVFCTQQKVRKRSKTHFTLFSVDIMTFKSFQINFSHATRLGGSHLIWHHVATCVMLHLFIL